MQRRARARAMEHGMSWTDERVETLKRLWGEGHSASQIANQLGGVSRNAVIGKVHRLGLEGRAAKAGKTPEEAATVATDEPEVAAASDNVTPLRPAAPAAPEPEPLRAANDAGPADGDADSDPESEIAVPVPRKLKLVQLTERTCKWPIGDPMHDDFHFCGHEAEEGRPYCEYHSNQAFQPASERRRVR